MNYFNVDLEDLIDTSRVRDMKPTYQRVIHTMPLQTKDTICLDDELNKVPSPPTTDMSSFPSLFSLPLLVVTLKKMKLDET